MSASKYIPEPERKICGTDAFINASADDLRILIAAKELGGATAEELARAAGCSVPRAEGAAEYWTEHSVMNRSDAEESESVSPAPLPIKRKVTDEFYRPDAKELAEKIDGLGLSSLIDECEKICGKTFNQNELSIIVGMRNELSLGEGYILTLIAFCFNTLEKKTLRYAEKVAFSLTDSGIDTLDSLNDYIIRREKMLSQEGKLRRLFGFGDRALTKKESACFDKWINDFSYGEDIIRLAYDLTADQTGKASVGYADKILSNWNAEGCRTVADCEAKILENKNSPEKERPARRKSSGKAAAGPVSGSFDTDDFFKKALERSYGKK